VSVKAGQAHWAIIKHAAEASEGRVNLVADTWSEGVFSNGWS